ncbi:CHAT domain-containing protein [Thermomonospora cellulosilytica]|uniref:CHAT domain-containing protein/tetratricopeptide (TPR) repeat protein n=1 Tax=Thermomonospora cellulosilytica TaxID=1411118 RepID=A0A7W3MVY8_9ACTN|nr:CHAT domain-containing protein [Thermomonospora cellulosilytica]MBA9002839.1 CHAT domain-containing protein/tetratricopeptide (TPR) repeat protein [Thermomonospora cellulosilytica]
MADDRCRRLLERGRALVDQARFDMARQAFEEALACARSSGDDYVHSRALAGLGNCAYYTYKFSEAEHWYRQQHALARVGGDDAELGVALGNLGNLAMARRDFSEARRLQAESVRHALAAGDVFGAGQSALSVVWIDVHEGVGDPDSPFLALARKAAHHSEASALFRARVAVATGACLLGVSKPNEAAGEYMAALGHLDGWSHPGVRAGALLGLAESALLLDRADDAINWARQAVAASEDASTRSRSATIRGWAHFLGVRDLARALADIDEAIELSEQLGESGEILRALVFRAQLHNATNEFDQALHDARAARALAVTRRDRVAAQVEIGYALLGSGETAAAERAFQEVANEGSTTGSGDDALFTLTGLAASRLAAGQIDQAAEAAYQGVAAFEQIPAHQRRLDPLRPALSQDRATNIYRLLEHAQCEQQRTTEALMTFNRRAEHSLWRLAHALSPDPTPSPTHPAPTHVPPDVMDRLSSTGSIMVVWSVHQDYLWSRRRATRQVLIWVITPEGRVHFRRIRPRGGTRPWEANVELAAVMAHQATRDSRGRSPSSGSAIARDSYLAHLAALLLDPIADLLADCSNLVLVPDSSLYYIPFTALPWRDGRLVDQFAVTVCPSLSHLTRLPEPSDDLDVLVAGVSHGGHVDLGVNQITLGPLPWAKVEAEAIADFFAVTPLIGAQATREAILGRLSRARVIHLAAHGSADLIARDGLAGVVFLAHPDGFAPLTAGDVLSAAPHAELVVLSGCDTAGGTPTAEGPIGLVRAFLAAGCSQVLASLFPVQDRSTKELMERFHCYRREGDSSSSALRRAINEARAGDVEFARWSSYMLFGNL